MVRSKRSPDSQAVDAVDAKRSRSKLGRPSAALRMVLEAYDLVQLKADELGCTSTMTVMFHPGNQMPTITIEEARDKAPSAK